MTYHICRLWPRFRPASLLITSNFPKHRLIKNFHLSIVSKIHNNSSFRNFNYVSATGFVDYEQERKKRESISEVTPEYLNYFSDVIEYWASKETSNERKTFPAFWYVGRNGKEVKWNFQQLANQSRKAANVLRSVCGIRKGDRVMIFLPKIPELWIIILALCQIGAVASIGTVQLQPKDIHYRINSFKAKYVIANEETAERVDQIDGSCPSLRRKIICSQDQKNKGWIDFNSLHKEALPFNQCAKTRYNDPLILFFTSGTTGKPKMVQHSHECIKSFNSIGYYWMDLTSNQLVLNMSDLGWSKGIWGGLFVPWAMGAGIFVHYSNNFNAKTILQILQDYPITTFCASPTIFRKLIQSDLQNYKFPHLRHCLSAGEPLHAAANEQWLKKTGIYIYEGFGQAETSLICGMYRCIKRKPGSIGKPLPGIQLAILDSYYNELGPGKEGILSVKLKPKAPFSLFKEYLNNPKETNIAFRSNYYITGDRAYKDEEGYYWFVGRNDDIILSSGYTIGPCEVESALQEHPAVLESAVVSSPDPEEGETVKAFVVLNKEYLHMDKSQMMIILQDHVKNITSYKYPRKIEFVDELPKTDTGKIRRKNLRRKEWPEIKNEQNISVAS